MNEYIDKETEKENILKFPGSYATNIELMKSLNEEERNLLESNSADMSSFYEKKNEAIIGIIKDIVDNPDKYDMAYRNNTYRTGSWYYDKVEITIDPESGQKFTILPSELWNASIDKDEFHKFIPGLFKDDEDVVLKSIIETGINAIEYASEECKDSKYVAYNVMDEYFDREMYQKYFIDRHKNDKEFLTECIFVHPEAFKYLPEEIRDDKSFVMKVLENDSLNFCYASPRLRDDKEVVLAAIEWNGSNLEYASPRLQDDKDVVMEAIKDDSCSLEYASPRLKDDKDVVMEAIKNANSLLDYASPRLQDDKEVVLAAIECNSYNFKYASPRLQDDKEVVLAAIECNGYNFEYASPKLQDDKEVVLAAIEWNGSNLEYASPRLQDDKEVVLAAIKDDGYNLEYASPRLQDDKEIVLAAVRDTGCAYRYASPRLQNDKEIAIDAIKRSSAYLIFRHISPELQGNKDVVLAAIKNQGIRHYGEHDSIYNIVLENTSPALLKNEEFQKEALKICPIDFDRCIRNSEERHELITEKDDFDKTLEHLCNISKDTEKDKSQDKEKTANRKTDAPVIDEEYER